MSGVYHDGVYFSEEAVEGRTIAPVKCTINRQNSNLRDVKTRLATEVKALGGDAVGNFRYGQRAHKWWQRFRWDEESWFGEGVAVQLRSPAP